MFCENCGNTINPGEAFCENCGAPVPGAQPPVQQAPEAQPVQQPMQQPLSDQPTQQPYQQPVQQYVEQPMGGYAPMAPKPPKKPMSPTMKKILLFGSIGVAAIVAFLIVLFVVIVPGCKKAQEDANRKEVASYITFKANDIDSGQTVVYSGNFTGELAWDYTKFAEDAGVTEAQAKSFLDTFDSGLTYTVSVNGGEKETIGFNHDFEEVKEEDEYVVEVKWPEKPTGYELEYAVKYYGQDFVDAMDDPDKLVEKAAKTMGIDLNVKFKKGTTSKTIKVADELSKNGITFAKAQDIDLLGYIKDNNLIKCETGWSTASVTVDQMEATFGDYKIYSTYPSTYLNVSDKDGKDIGNISLDFSPSSDNLYDGDTVTLSYDSYYVKSLKKYGINLIGDPVEYKVDAPETTTSSSSDRSDRLTLTQAKDNVDKLKAYFTDHIFDEDSDAKTGDKLTLQSIYFCDDNNDQYVVWVYKNDTQNYFNTMYAYATTLEISGGKIIDNGSVYSWDDDKGKTADEAINQNYCMSYSPVLLSGDLSEAVTSPEPTTDSTDTSDRLTLTQAKDNVDKLKAYFTDHIFDEDTDAKTGDKLTLQNIYFCDDKNDQYVVWVYKNDTQNYFNTMYAYATTLEISGNKIVDNGSVYSWDDDKGKTADEAISENYCMKYDPVKLA